MYKTGKWGKIFCTNGEQAELRKNRASSVTVDVCHNLLHCTSFYAMHMRQKLWSEPHTELVILYPPPPKSIQRSRYSASLRAGRSGHRIPVGARFSAPVQTGPGTHPASYTMGTGSFPGVKRPGRGVDPPPSGEVEGRVKLYIFSPSGPSWPVPGWPLPLPLPLPPKSK